MNTCQASVYRSLSPHLIGAPPSSVPCGNPTPKQGALCFRCHVAERKREEPDLLSRLGKLVDDAGMKFVWTLPEVEAEPPLPPEQETALAGLEAVSLGRRP